MTDEGMRGFEDRQKDIEVRDEGRGEEVTARGLTIALAVVLAALIVLLFLLIR